MLARGRRKQSTPRKGTNTYRSMWRQILHAGNNLHPARGRIPSRRASSDLSSKKQSTPRKGTNTPAPRFGTADNLHPARGRILPANDFADGDLRIETIYTPQGDEYRVAGETKSSFHVETIYTPQGDEYPTIGLLHFPQNETIYTPQGDEYNSVIPSTVSVLRNNLHPARGRNYIKRCIEYLPC